jgi:8-oxo-dGTP pyrophosphatase MutT (NUDIX family)
MTPLSFDADSFASLARERLRSDPPRIGDLIARPRGDHDRQPTPLKPPDETLAIPAAVLIPVVSRPQGPTVLLTERAATLRAHSAQVAFPGGRIDAVDGSPTVAALREAEEEIGLPRDKVELLGYLDAYLTGTGYRVVPVVALVEPPFELMLNAHEVARVFEAPLSFLLDPANHRREGRMWQGVHRTYYAIRYEGHYIWGATAGMIRNLYETLAGATEES